MMEKLEQVNNHLCNINLCRENTHQCSLAKQYVLKYTTSKNDIENEFLWESLTEISEQDLVEGSLTPVAGGTNVKLKLKPSLFETDTDYFMAMKASDERNSISERSTIASFGRLIPPNKVDDFSVQVSNVGSNVQVSFTAPGDDGNVGTGNLNFLINNKYDHILCTFEYIL